MMHHTRLTFISRQTCWLLIALFMTLAISACGFQLRGVADLSFKNLYIQGGQLTLSRDLERQLKANGIKIVQKSEDAEVLLDLMSESSQRRIMSLSGGGLVREFELLYFLNFRIREASNPLWGPVQTIRGRRDVSYNDNVLLGKAEEEARLNQDMRNDAVRELLKRLTSYKPVASQQ
jgi:LPS-assembly lipoprotein